MFFHNFKYTLKTLFKNKMLIFWTFAFPLILGTFFKMAFSNIETSEKLDIIDIGIVNDSNFENNTIYKEAFKTLSDEENEDRLFNTKYVNLDEAKNMLNNKEITGYLVIENDTPKIVISSNGINETILKSVTEEIVQTSSLIQTKAENEVKKEIMAGNYNIDYEKIYKNVLEVITNENVKLNNISNSNLSYTMIEYYTLIAMTCLYGGILSMTAINYNLANISSKGKRVAISPVNKIKIILSSTFASYVVQLIGLLLLFVYTIFVLRVDYGNNLFLVIILAIVGSLSGLSLGTFVGTVFKFNENAKVGFVIAVTMLGCFLSGMMGITMKYIVDKNIPIVNKLNPASMITDGFYSLYYYNTLDRYYFDVISLVIFACIMLGISFISLRRQKYDSI